MAIASNPEQLYFPEPGEAQLTWRAIGVGLILGCFVSMINVYFGLQIGWSVGGSIIAAILAYAFFSALNPTNSYGLLENNISQTIGSAGSGMATAVGTSNLLPALNMLGYQYSTGVLLIWGFSVALIGVCFAVPLRRQMVVLENLRFPTGFATAEVISAMYQHGGQAKQKSRILLQSAVLAAAISLLLYFCPIFAHIPVLSWVGLGAATAYGFTIFINPMMFGAGLIIGPRVGISLMVGAVIGWGFIGDFVYQQGWVTGGVHDYKSGLQGWLLWVGVALMLGDSLMALLLSWKTAVRAFHWKHDEAIEDKAERIPNTWWMLGLLLSSIMTMCTLQIFFAVNWYLTGFAIFLSLILAMIATRSLGETDINPVGAMGKVTQLAFGKHLITTNLMAAGVTAAGAAAAGDMMQDLKTGYMLGASPKKQFIAQCCGVFSGVLGAVLVYKLFETAYDFSTVKDLPMPAAHAWKAMAEFVTKGFSALPPHTTEAVTLGFIVGLIIPILRKVPKLGDYAPSGMAFGIALIVPAFYSLAMFLGTAFYLLWGKVSAKSREVLCFALASGLIVGDGLVGILNAGLHLIGINPILT